MSQYKVPQNVEAEDKIIGPLTFKQFIYALIGFGWGALSFAIFRFFPPILILVGLPPVLLFLLLAFYNRDGQNFEQLLVAMVGYFANPRRRIWRKEEAVVALRIEPRKVAVEQTQRNPAEVRSELDRLAELVDSRGWNIPTETRIITPVAEPAELDSEIKATQDILDLQHSPAAQNLNLLIQEAAADVRAEAIEQMKIRATTAAPSVSTVTTPVSNDILKLAKERDDIPISQLAANANRIVPLQEGQSVNLRNNGSQNQ